MNSLAPPRPDQARPSVSDLTAAMTSRRAKIGVIGLGYVGLPLALAPAKAGFATLGFDVDEPRVRQINRGESFIKRIPAASIAAAVSEGKFAATADFSRLSEPDTILSGGQRSRCDRYAQRLSAGRHRGP